MMFNRMDEKRIAFGAKCGFIAFALFIGSVGLSLILNPWFVWTDMALSDLGVFGEHQLVFRGGMIATGIALVFFGFGFGSFLKEKNDLPSKGFIVAGIGMIGVGIFPEGYLHILSVCFVLLAIAVILVSLTWLKKDQRFSVYASITFTICLSSVFLFLFVEGYALAEMVVFSAVGLLLLLFSYRMHVETKGLI